MTALTGPLGNHRHYLTHIALANCMDYLRVRREHAEAGDTGLVARFQQLRYFLNALESLDNIIEYYYRECSERLPYASLDAYRDAVHQHYPDLREAAELAAAYRCGTLALQADFDWALLMPDTDGELAWPVAGHDRLFDKVLRFWLAYQQNISLDPLALASD
ncbi:hypothetical protein CAI21_04365 [Alkalilimnicola ehrlichii]|uniref:Uncharacterized protein n=1 Tax=Alkalilimnicola ehrlichii TaxID=351052 RepID=A0A3E0WZP4_9GAMM|nr:hypothetical protein [Alkalilimnicola ehrlichii]RFA30748.1 hypothetical protein CAI21_04365 [Alkalilimnicola ehrlichii]RFA38324.1 hypothetical protein CAL65_05730 [Alkalilimnicola ehrlichii]